MSPEQATGGKVDARSDVFSFGAMLYEMVTGARAFAGGSSADTLSAVLRGQPKAPSEIAPGVPGDLEKVILRCLRKDPERRFQHVADLKVLLQEIKEESDSGRPAAPTVVDRGRRAKGAVISATVIGTAMLGVIAVTSWMLMKKQDSALAPSLVLLTGLQGFEYHPTFSPDGEQVAFSWNGEREDNWDIYLMLVGSSELRRLTMDASRDGTPSWSPDGRQIAFLREIPDGQAIYLVSPVTGTERKLGTGSGLRGLSWSPDGRWLATTQNTAKQGLAICLITSAGGELKVLAKAQGLRGTTGTRRSRRTVDNSRSSRARPGDAAI